MFLEVLNTSQIYPNTSKVRFVKRLTNYTKYVLDNLDSFVRYQEFETSPASLAKLLRITHSIPTESREPYPKRTDKINPAVDALGGHLSSTSPPMKTVNMSLDVEDLGLLYPVKKLTAQNLGRTLLFYDLRVGKNIDICEHIFYLMETSAKIGTIV